MVRCYFRSVRSTEPLRALSRKPRREASRPSPQFRGGITAWHHCTASLMTQRTKIPSAISSYFDISARDFRGMKSMAENRRNRSTTMRLVRLLAASGRCCCVSPFETRPDRVFPRSGNVDALRTDSPRCRPISSIRCSFRSLLTRGRTHYRPTLKYRLGDRFRHLPYS